MCWTSQNIYYFVHLLYVWVQSMRQLVDCCTLLLFAQILLSHSYINSFIHWFPCDRIRPRYLCIVSSVSRYRRIDLPEGVTMMGIHQTWRFCTSLFNCWKKLALSNEVLSQHHTDTSLSHVIKLWQSAARSCEEKQKWYLRCKFMHL